MIMEVIVEFNHPPYYVTDRGKGIFVPAKRIMCNENTNTYSLDIAWDEPKELWLGRDINEMPTYETALCIKSPNIGSPWPHIIWGLRNYARSHNAEYVGAHRTPRGYISEIIRTSLESRWDEVKPRIFRKIVNN